MIIPKYIEKFEQEMDRRFMSKKTIKTYSCGAEKFLFFFQSKEHPLHISEEDFKFYLYDDFEEQNTQRSNHSAVKKFYECIFNKERFRYVKYANKKETQIIILSEVEMQHLLQVTTYLKHFCITLLFYSTGIRINELLNIKVRGDIDPANGVIYIRGKGNKPRIVPLKGKMLEVLRKYYQEYKPVFWLFENDKTHKRYTEGSINGFLKYNAVKAGITKKVHAHLIRHCYGSHSISHAGLYMVQQILGHSDPKITANTYIHNSPTLISAAYSPIDSLPLLNPQLQLPCNR